MFDVACRYYCAALMHSRVFITPARRRQQHPSYHAVALFAGNEVDGVQGAQANQRRGGRQADARAHAHFRHARHRWLDWVVSLNSSSRTARAVKAKWREGRFFAVYVLDGREAEMCTLRTIAVAGQR